MPHKYSGITAPVINLNGSSPGSLSRDYVKALTAVEDAISAVQFAAPHGRDYQTAPDGNYSYLLARRQHQDRIERLSLIAKELTKIAEAIAEQITSREVNSNEGGKT